MNNDNGRGACRVIALGFFDGVHVGHGALLRRVAETAARLGAVPSAFTFDTHPEKLILKSPMPLLSTPADRAWLMCRYYGIRDVIVAPFDRHMMHMPWREFVTEFLVKNNAAVHLVAGHDFHFGYQGEGNPDRLRALCREVGLGCDIVPKVEQDHITVSSTYIRTLVAQGELERAGFFLGHPHTLQAEADAPAGPDGAAALRFPPGILLPEAGAYLCQVHAEDAAWPSALEISACGGAPTLWPLDGGGAVGGGPRLELFARLERAPGRAGMPLSPEEAGRIRSYFTLRGI